MNAQLPLVMWHFGRTTITFVVNDNKGLQLFFIPASRGYKGVLKMASSSNPYEHYNSPHVGDDDDLIDPDDGTYSSLSTPTTIPNQDHSKLINYIQRTSTISTTLSPKHNPPAHPSQATSQHHPPPALSTKATSPPVSRAKTAERLQTPSMNPSGKRFGAIY